MISVPLIPSDLRHGETIVQASLALDLVQQQINIIFDRIDKRLSADNERVKTLGERIERAQTKIDRLVGTKKAIRIYSPARFCSDPSHIIFHDVPATFVCRNRIVDGGGGICADKEMAEQHRHQVQQQCEEVLSHRNTDAGPHDLNEKLVFFHVRSVHDQHKEHGSNSHINANILPPPVVDLGTMPKHLNSVSSLLLFNTDERMYVPHRCNEYAADDEFDGVNWKRAKLFKNQRQRPPVQGAPMARQNPDLLELAPPSLVNRARQRLATPSGGLRYTPKLLEAPAIDLPLDLPDLPMIADDVNYDIKTQQQQLIAPSLFIENLPDLSDLVNDKATATTNEQNITITASLTEKSFEGNSLTPIRRTVSGAQRPTPPPPPPPPQIPPSNPLENDVALSIQAPPPPPPPPPSIIIPVISQCGVDAVPPALSVSSDSRTDLMASIRKAGGTRGGRLRSAAIVTTSDSDCIDAATTNNKIQQSKNSNQGGGGGNLMADLHNKLLMRRKGISGANVEKTNMANKSSNIKVISKSLAITENTVISHLSALIPPPSTIMRNHRYTDDDDDDDEADWTE